MSQPSPDPLVAAVARTEGAIAASTPGEAWPWRFARCWMLATRVEDHGGTVAELDAAVAEFHLLPGDAPARAKLAAVLVVAQQRRSMLGEYGRVRQAVALADIANTDPAPLPAWPKADAALRSMYLLHRLMRGTEDLPAERALRELERYGALVGDEQPYAMLVDLVRTEALMLRARERRDFASMEEALVLAESLRRQHGTDALAGPRLTVIAEYLTSTPASRAGSGGSAGSGRSPASRGSVSRSTAVISPAASAAVRRAASHQVQVPSSAGARSPSTRPAATSAMVSAGSPRPAVTRRSRVSPSTGPPRASVISPAVRSGDRVSRTTCAGRVTWMRFGVSMTRTNLGGAAGGGPEPLSSTGSSVVERSVRVVGRSTRVVRQGT